MLDKNIRYYDTLDSTNTKLKELAECGAKSGLVIRAGCQTSGRGRLGRNWESARGEGLYMSMLLRQDAIDASMLPAPTLLTPVTGLAVRNAAARFINTDVRIKWPNDVIVGRRKLSGILVEAIALGGELRRFIIGIGVNVNTRGFSRALSDSATSLFLETGECFDIDEIAAAIVDEADMLYTRLFAGDKRVLEEYTAHCANIGKMVRLTYNEGEIRGKAVGINAEGELLIELQTGRITVVRSGEVSLRGSEGYT